MQYYQIHEAASLVPLASKEEQDALRDDIETNGQQVPISLYRGKIVDGRCRQNACIELGISVDAVELPNNMSLKDVNSFVKSVNTRRNLTNTQKAFTALREMDSKQGLTLSAQAKRWGISRQELGNAKFIKENRPEYEKILFNGGKIEFTSPEGVVKKGTHLYTLRKAIESQVKQTIETKSDVAGQVHIAKAFDQLRTQMKYLPPELTTKETIFILRTIIVNLEAEGSKGTQN